jgi:phage tail-like protein
MTVTHEITGLRLGLGMRFRVEIDGFTLGNWATCQGLSVSFNPVPVEEGGTNEYVPWVPGTVKYKEITLTRAVIKEEIDRVMTWLSGQAEVFSPGTGSITLYDGQDEQVYQWSLHNVYPHSWSGPSLDAGSSKVAMETLVLVHEGFL